jgi:hypothetical protein
LLVLISIPIGVRGHVSRNLVRLRGGPRGCTINPIGRAHACLPLGPTLTRPRVASHLDAGHTTLSHNNPRQIPLLLHLLPLVLVLLLFRSLHRSLAGHKPWRRRSTSSTSSSAAGSRGYVRARAHLLHASSSFDLEFRFLDLSPRFSDRSCIHPGLCGAGVRQAGRAARGARHHLQGGRTIPHPFSPPSLTLCSNYFHKMFLCPCVPLSVSPHADSR